MGEDVDDDMEDEFYLKRLDSGLFTLQLIDYIMLEICASGSSSVSYAEDISLSQTPPSWPSGSGVRLKSSRPWVRYYRFYHGSFSWSSHTSDFKIGTPVATLPDAWHYRVSTGTG